MTTRISPPNPRSGWRTGVESPRIATRRRTGLAVYPLELPLEPKCVDARHTAVATQQAISVDNLSSYSHHLAMKQVGVADLKNNLSRHLRLVEGGEAIEVTDHDRPIARLVPIETKTHLAIRPPLRPFSEVSHLRFTPLGLPVSSTELLREERDIR
jgi:prevent-host-death family protein